MKKIIICSLLLVLTTATFSQQNIPSPTLTKQDFLKKSKSQKTAAWVLLGGGFALSSIGALTAVPKAAEDVGYGILLIPNVFTGNLQPEPQNNYTAQTILLIGGLTTILSSTPLFIASGKNKRKALSISFKSEPSPQLQKNSFVYRAVPSLTLKFQL